MIRAENVYGYTADINNYYDPVSQEWKTIEIPITLE